VMRTHSHGTIGGDGSIDGENSSTACRVALRVARGQKEEEALW